MNNINNNDYINDDNDINNIPRKLSDILRVDPISITGVPLDMVDVDFRKNFDVKSYVDPTLVAEQTGSAEVKTKLFDAIYKIMNDENLTDKEKLEKICQENEFTKLLGLGSSKGKEHSVPKGAKQKVMDGIFKWIRALVDEDEIYYDTDYLQFILFGLGKDGLSDIFCNLCPEIMKEKAWEIIQKLRTLLDREDSIFTPDENLYLSEDSSDPYIEYTHENGTKVRRYPTSAEWVIDEHGDAAKEINGFINVAKRADESQMTVNGVLRGMFVSLLREGAAYKFNMDNNKEFDKEAWMVAVDAKNALKEKFESYILARECMHLQDDADIQTLLRQVFQFRTYDNSLEFYVKKMQNATKTLEAKYDFTGNPQTENYVIMQSKNEVSLLTKETEISSIVELEGILNSNFKNLTKKIIIFTEKQKSKKLAKELSATEVSLNIKDIIIFRWNYYTESEISNKLFKKGINGLTDEEKLTVESEFMKQKLIEFKD